MPNKSIPGVSHTTPCKSVMLHLVQVWAWAGLALYCVLCAVNFHWFAMLCSMARKMVQPQRTSSTALKELTAIQSRVVHPSQKHHSLRLTLVLHSKGAASRRSR